MKHKMRQYIALLTAALLLMSFTACGGGSAADTSVGTSAGANASADANSQAPASESAPAGTPTFNPTGFPIMSEPITLTALVEGDTTYQWDTNEFVKKYAEITNINLKLQAVPQTEDGLAKRNLLLASGDYPDIMLHDWITMIKKADAMRYGVQEGIIIPITQYIDEYGVNMKRLFDYNPFFKTTSTAPDGEIYGVPRFSECYHCLAYPKIYMRNDWLTKLSLKMPTTTEELRTVLKAFIEQDPNGSGSKDEIGLTGATTWNTPVEWALMGMAYQTVKPDFWLSLDRDGKEIEVSVMTEHYREGLRYIKSLYDEGLIDPAAFTQKDDQMAQTVRSEPHIVGAYTADHAGMGYDNHNSAEAEAYQIMLPVAGPDGFQRQGQNANEGEIQGYHAVITDKCQYPEAAFRYFDSVLLDEDIFMERMFGQKGTGWDAAPAGTKDVFGDDARYTILPLGETERETLKEVWNFGPGPQPDIAPFRMSQMPAGDNYYTNDMYEQRITLDSEPLMKFIPEKRLAYTVFMPLDLTNEYSEIQTNLNSFIRMATVQFIMGERDIETGWDQYISELKSYNVDRYLEIYKSVVESQ